MGYRIDLTGKPFGLLVVVSFDYDKNKWKCKCACGNFCYVFGRDLRSKNTRSCGCIRSTSNRSHGMRYTKFYKHWITMRYRCNGVNNKDYHYYGGRGIAVCDRWNDFLNFKEEKK